MFPRGSWTLTRLPGDVMGVKSKLLSVRWAGGPMQMYVGPGPQQV